MAFSILRGPSVLHAAALVLLAVCDARAQDQLPGIDAQIKKLADEAPLAMRFRGSTAEECKAWQKEFGAKLDSLLGPHAPPAKWRAVVQRVTELHDHRREELMLRADGCPPLPMYLLSPLKKSARRLPGIVALHGHGGLGHHPVAGKDDLPGVANAIKQANYDYGRQLARRGYVVAVPCLIPFGDRLDKRESYSKQDPCAITFIRLQMLGKVLIAENLRDARWATDALARDPRVAPERLGCVGLSYGGRMAMLTAAREPRIRVVVISGALNVMQERIGKAYSCGAQVIPGLLQYGDVPEIASLIAPRPCLWEVGARDTLISPTWAKDALMRIGRAYKAFGAEDKLQVDRFDGGHEWHGDMAYELLDNVLLAK